MDGIQKSMSDSLAAGGSTARNYVKVDGTRGDYLDKFAAVYKRQDQPCKRCGRDIIKTRVAGHTLLSTLPANAVMIKYSYDLLSLRG